MRRMNKNDYGKRGKMKDCFSYFKFQSILLVLLLICGLCFSGEFAERAVNPGGGESRFEDLIAEAVENNPAIQSAYHEWQAERHVIAQARSFPDPMGHVAFFGKEIETRVGPQKARYGVSQKVPFPGKQILRGKAAERKAKMAYQKYEAVKSETIKELKFALLDIYWVDKAVEIYEDEKRTLNRIIGSAERMYETGKVTQKDVFKAQAELSRLLEKIYGLTQRRESLRARVNMILDRPVQKSFGKIPDFEAAPFSYSLENLKEISAENREELLIADIEIEKREYEKSLSTLDYFPDVTFGWDYFVVDSGHTTLTSPRDGEDAWMGSVSFNIPIWFDRLIAQTREKSARLKAARSKYLDMQNMVQYEIEDMYHKILTYKDILSLYETALIPQTRSAYDSAQAGYEAGTVDFLSWLDSERILLGTRIAYYKALVDYEKSLAYLERIVGKDL